MSDNLIPSEPGPEGDDEVLSAQGERIKICLNYDGGLDFDKCTAPKISPETHSFFRRNAWLLLLPWARSRGTFAR